MKLVVITLTVFTVLNLSFADDDGLYHPEVHSGYYGGNRPNPYNDYRRGYNNYPNYYRDVAGWNNNIASTYNPYQQYYRGVQPAQDLLAPFASYDNRKSVEEISTTLAPTTTSTVPITYRPVAYSTTPTATVPPPASSPPQTRIQYRGSDGNARLIQDVYDLDTKAKTYHYRYKSDNGITAEESGRADTGNGEGNVVVGFYEFVAADGVTYRVDYTADKYGFHPRGAHLPV